MRFNQVPIVILAAALVALILSVLIPAYAQTPAPTAGTFDIPPEVAGHDKEWTLANHDYANTRLAVGSSINASNVAGLKIAWTSPLKGTAE